ncbi:MAG: hypothetical protein M3198_11775, partial [Actinomycetota bacterium]|nr:hypothetical protein [Actinomycetota bacterium]
VLFLFPTPEREIRARERLGNISPFALATSHTDAFYDDPLGRVWLLLDSDQRIDLFEVARREVSS